MSTYEEAENLARKVAKFVKHNQIDTGEYNLDQIVAAYFEASRRADEQLIKDLTKFFEPVTK